MTVLQLPQAVSGTLVWLALNEMFSELLQLAQ